MPQQQMDHAWRDFRTPQARLQQCPDPEPTTPHGPAFYARVAASLADGIERRVWKQGEKLPPAAQIADRYATSVDTARWAVRWLIEHQYAERQPGGAAYCRGPKIAF